uniref:Uncharacterized protein n=1 Tax=Rhizophora mucronata TaxID=61149 RepID=A0A2P2KFS2_RHIMU
MMGCTGTSSNWSYSSTRNSTYGSRQGRSCTGSPLVLIEWFPNQSRSRFSKAITEALICLLNSLLGIPGLITPYI